MKKKKIITALSVVALLGGGVTITSCADQEVLDLPIYSVSVSEIEGVTLSVDKTTAVAGETVSVTVTVTDEEAIIYQILVNDEIVANKNSETLYTFIMPEANAVIRAVVVYEPTIESGLDAFINSVSGTITHAEISEVVYSYSAYYQNYEVADTTLDVYSNGDEINQDYRLLNGTLNNGEAVSHLDMTMVTSSREGDAHNVYATLNNVETPLHVLSIYDNTPYLNEVTYGYANITDNVLASVYNELISYNSPTYTMMGFTYSEIELSDLGETWEIYYEYSCPEDDYAGPEYHNVTIEYDKVTNVIVGCEIQYKLYASGASEELLDSEVTSHNYLKAELTYGELEEGNLVYPDEESIPEENIEDNRSEASISELSTGTWNETDNVADAYNVLMELGLYAKDATKVTFSGKTGGEMLSDYSNTLPGTISGSVTRYNGDVVESIREIEAVDPSTNEEVTYSLKTQVVPTEALVYTLNEEDSSLWEEKVISGRYRIGRSVSDWEELVGVYDNIVIGSVGGVSASLRENGGFGHFEQLFGVIDVYFYEGSNIDGKIYLDVGYDFNIEAFGMRVIYRVKITIEDGKLISIDNYESNSGAVSEAVYNFEYGETTDFTGSLIEL